MKLLIRIFYKMRRIIVLPVLFIFCSLIGCMLLIFTTLVSLIKPLGYIFHRAWEYAKNVCNIRFLYKLRFYGLNEAFSSWKWNKQCLWRDFLEDTLYGFVEQFCNIFNIAFTLNTTDLINHCTTYQWNVECSRKEYGDFIRGKSIRTSNKKLNKGKFTTRIEPKKRKNNNV